LRLGPGDRDAGPASINDERITMPRSLILSLALLAVALLAVPAALAKGGQHRVVRVHGMCTQQSTSTLKLSREDRGIEVEFEVDQNRNGVPWRVELRRNGTRVASFTATTRAPSGSFEVRRVIAGRFRTDRIKAIAMRAGERCTTVSGAPRTSAAGTATSGAAQRTDDGAGHDVGDDNGHDVGDDGGHHSGGDS
jgi:hypothetical protein